MGETFYSIRMARAEIGHHRMPDAERDEEFAP
jgi:hypothetical protein